jgi:CDP-glucose 4,6-dehydratase
MARHPHENRYLKLDCSKARALLSWAPKLPLSTALEWVVEWYRAYQGEVDMRTKTLEQIKRFEAIRVEV